MFLVSETHPTVDGTVVTTNVCMRDGSNPCVKQYEIQILKCESFYLYNLSRPETCDIAYCFGKIFDISFEQKLLAFIDSITGTDFYLSFLKANACRVQNLVS